MDNLVSSIIGHMAHSHQQLARIMQAKKEVAVNMARVIDAIPDTHHSFADVETVAEQSSGVTKSVCSYLNSLAALEESLADNLDDVMKEMSIKEKEEKEGKEEEE